MFFLNTHIQCAINYRSQRINIIICNVKLIIYSSAQSTVHYYRPQNLNFQLNFSQWHVFKTLYYFFKHQRFNIVSYCGHTWADEQNVQSEQTDRQIFECNGNCLLWNQLNFFFPSDNMGHVVLKLQDIIYCLGIIKLQLQVFGFNHREIFKS